MPKIPRALISVSDKTGIVELASGLASLEVEILSTGGTAKLLREKGLKVRDVSDLTGFPEMLDGRVKTLHPKVHGGLLAVRSNPQHQAQVKEHGIEFIDMVVVNLYPFEKTAAKPGVTLEELIENIDIGGPSMLRSAAKNFEDVTVLVDAADYPVVLEEMQRSGGSVSRETRARLARKAFATTAAYDSAISTTLQKMADRGISGEPPPELPQGDGSAVRRESAPEGGALSQSRRGWTGPGGRSATPGQGTFLQQPGGSGGGLAPGAGV